MAAYVLSDNDVFFIAIYCQTLDQVSVNKVAVRCTVDPASTQTDFDLVSALDDAAAPLWKAFMPPQAQYGGTTARKRVVPGVIQPRTAYGFANQGPGTLIDGMLPPQTCGLLNLASSTLGLRAQGRVYLPFPGQFLNNDDGTPSPANYPAAVQPIGDFLITPFILPVGGPAEVTCSFGHYSLVDNYFYSYDRRWWQDRWATQRRRSQYNVKNWLPGGAIM